MSTKNPKTAIRLVETVKGRHMLERTKRYRVMLYGRDVGALYYNMRGYVGYLPLPCGAALDIGERPIAEFKREVARLNREFRKAMAHPETAGATPCAD